MIFLIGFIFIGCLVVVYVCIKISKVKFKKLKILWNCFVILNIFIYWIKCIIFIYGYFLLRIVYKM